MKNRIEGVVEGPRLYLDVRKFKKEELALILAENRLANLEHKISPYPLLFTREGRVMMIDDTNGRIKPLPIKENTALQKKEVLGMRRIWEMEKRGYEVVAWFSPCGGDAGYDEDRMVVAARRHDLNQVGWLSSFWEEDPSLEKVILRELEMFMRNGGMLLEARGICSFDKRETFFGKVSEVIRDRRNQTFEPIEAIDDLRANPVGINTGEKKWFDYLGEYFPDLEEVWKAISRGEDLRDKLENRRIAAEVRQLFGARIDTVETYHEAVALGAQIERYIQVKHSIFLNRGGNHGFSNQAVAGGSGAFGELYTSANIFDGEQISSEGGSDKLTLCKVHGMYYLKKRGGCPLCSKN